MKHNDTSHVIFLENTQTIFNGVDRLYKLHNAYPQYTIEDLVSWQWDSCYPQAFLPEETRVRYQNPLHLFFEFLKGNPYVSKNTDLEKACKEETVKMLNLYCAAADLDNEISKKMVPDKFELLCSCMRDIMCCDVCYLLYSQRDQTELLSISSLPRDAVSQQLDPAIFDNLRLYIQKERKKKEYRSKIQSTNWPVADTVYVPNCNDLFARPSDTEMSHNLVSIVLDYPKYPKGDWHGEWVYMVFQYKEAVPSREILLHHARNVLFMRKKILEHCMNYMYLLLMAQRSYQYVSSLNDASIEGGTRHVRILHLTDLHLQPSNQRAAMDFANNIYKASILTKPVDLLVITGDVVQANYSAGLLERNYTIAEDFIRTLASNLWTTPNGYVRADWQKRVIIIPGNHDYASMNELQAASMSGAKRAIGSGYPARNEGGPMVKFAYYINFLCRLFRMDMNALIESHLNEMRCYRELGLSILALNTISEAGPLRTNKVLMNIPIITERIHATDLKGQFPLLLCHHTPSYPVKYLMDRYWQNCDVNFATQEAWVMEFAKCLESILKIAENTDPIILDVEMEPIRNKLLSIRDAIIGNTAFNLFNPEKYDLLWDIVRTLDVISAPPFFSEQIAALCRSVEADQKMAKRDKQLLDENFKTILKDMQYQLVLGGHTHELKIEGSNTLPTTNYSTLDPTEIPYIEGNIFLRKKDAQNKNSVDTLNFGVLDIAKLSNPGEWEVSCQYYQCAYMPNRTPIISYAAHDVRRETWNMYTKK